MSKNVTEIVVAEARAAIDYVNSLRETNLGEVKELTIPVQLGGATIFLSLSGDEIDDMRIPLPETMRAQPKSRRYQMKQVDDEVNDWVPVLLHEGTEIKQRDAFYHTLLDTFTAIGFINRHPTIV